MRTSVERLRIGLLVGAGLLVLVIAAFLGYARYRVGKVIADLPGKLGATVTKEFNGYTYSQSDGKRTIFTIHAAKAMQHSDGKLTLHDVSMILYGHSGDRADRISGDDFEYDTKAQVVTAIGVVHLDLDASAPTGDPNSDARKHLSGPAQSGHDDATLGGHVIHVKTSGLVYTKQTGVATTDQGLEFAFGGYTGHAVGAVYNSSTGQVVLQSAITLSGVDKGRPISLRASHGELDRTARRADFRDARYSSAGQVAQADMAQIHLREDNSVERIDCMNNVALEDGVQGKVNSQRAEISLSATNRLKAAVLTGGVRFDQQRPERQAQGESERANLEFDEHGDLSHAVMQGRVKTVEHLRASEANAASPERTLASDALEVWLASAGVGARSQVRDMKATGSVSMLTAGGRSASDAAARKFSGDLLTAHMVPVNGSPEISTVHGSGHTAIEQKGADGIFQKSTGDTLDAIFHQIAGAVGKSSPELASAIQQGGVAIERTVPAKVAGAASDVQHATAQKAAFDAATNHLTLTGDVAMNDPGRQILAAKVVIAQGSGDATADGGVKATYQQAGSAEPAHVLAARAELSRSSGKAVFYGRGPSGAGAARLWQAGTGGQGGSQVEAPVLVFEETGGSDKDKSRKESRLTARAETAGTSGMVHAVLAEGNASKGGGAKPAGQLAKTSGTGVARIVSSEMVYSDSEKRVDFTGGVRMIDGSGEVKALSAVVYLAAATPSSPGASSHAATAGGLLGGKLDRIVANHQIELTQPGRKATGDRLIYTASDQMFVLTGTASAPPRVVDAQQGSTTGAALRFHSGDNNVVISGTDGEAPARKVETETRVKQ
ncbi:lipopolysaccharide export system protein LptA [Granulicella aggregans]|uniref:Lipopolysaccharide export system protein LptA n=1 Tax=Granulicella aggregans TaxID=474949 RepID=A0A7W7Z9F6_9BACT|nr:LptA/OstA family protein [Granulicella aggregans]MBB5055648.1 lipopolysaccharide export system protein LptA [Granulicella aggregans]